MKILLHNWYFIKGLIGVQSTTKYRYYGSATGKTHVFMSECYNELLLSEDEVKNATFEETTNPKAK